MRYIVRLAPAAERVIRTLEPFDQQGLDRVLAEELMDGPNADKEIRFDSDGSARVYVDQDHPDGRLYYTATPLSFKAYTAIHRPMTEDELSRACREDADPKAEHGIYVFEILAAESAFTRRPGGLSARPPRPPKRDLPRPAAVPARTVLSRIRAGQNRAGRMRYKRAVAGLREYRPGGGGGQPDQA